MDDLQRERRRRQRQRVSNCCRKLAAFLFSHIGLATMVVAYSIMGGFLFREIEAPEELRIKIKITEFKEEKIDEIWQLVSLADIPGRRGVPSEAEQKSNFTGKIRKIFSEFQEKVRNAVKDQGWDGQDAAEDSPLQWSFAGALLYAVTVITTIGENPFMFVLEFIIHQIVQKSWKKNNDTGTVASPAHKSGGGPPIFPVATPPSQIIVIRQGNKSSLVPMPRR